MRIVTDTLLLAEKIETPPEIVGGGVLGYQAFTLLTGQEGIGKSLLVMQLATHIARGQPWLGFSVDKPHRVLLVQKELPDSELQARLRAQDPTRPIASEFYIALDSWDIRLPPDGQPTALDEAIRGIKPRVIILDPLAQFATVNENDASQIAASVLAPIDRWKSWGCSVILVHHHGKPNEEFPRTGTNRVRGSSALAAACDTNLQLLEINRDKCWYQLDFAKLRRRPPQEHVKLWRDPAKALYHIRTPDTTKQATGS